MCRPLLDILAELPDPRGRRGRQYPLPALLGLTLVALLAGHTTLAAISHFGRLRGHRLGHALGFRDGKMPCPNTLANLLARIDPDALDAAVGTWLAGRHAAGWTHVAIDGKVLRGSRDGDTPGTHLLAAYAPQAAAVIAQMAVDATTNEHKAALRLLGALPPLKGAAVTADAMFTHADVCDAIAERGGHYVLYAKGNQPDLLADLETTFSAAEGGDFPPPSAGRVGRAGRGGDEPGEVAGPGRDADADRDGVAERLPEGVAGADAGVPAGATAGREGGRDGGGRVRGHEPAGGAGDGGGVAGALPGALGDREWLALRSGRDAAGGRVPGAAGERPAGVGGVAERGGVPAAAA